MSNTTRKDENNPFLKWIVQHHDAFIVDAFNPDNHNKVLDRYPGSQERYDEFAKQIKKCTKKHNVSDLVTYWALVNAIAAQKRKNMRLNGERLKNNSDESNDTVNAVLMPKEGNNRIAVLLQLVFASDFDPWTELFVTDSLTTNWMTRMLFDSAEHDGTMIKENFKNINLSTIIADLYDDKTTHIFHYPLNPNINFGIESEKFSELDCSISNEQGPCSW